MACHRFLHTGQDASICKIIGHQKQIMSPEKVLKEDYKNYKLLDQFYLPMY